MATCYLVSAGSWLFMTLGDSRVDGTGRKGLLLLRAVFCESSHVHPLFSGPLNHPSCVCTPSQRLSFSDSWPQNLQPQNPVAPVCRKCSSLGLVTHGLTRSSDSPRLGIQPSYDASPHH